MEVDNDLNWMDSFVQEESPEDILKQRSQFSSKTFYNDNSSHDQQTIKRQKQRIKELEQKLYESTNQPMKSQRQGGLSSSNSHQDLEVDYSELQFGKKISQGGFSIVYKGKFRGTTVAIKKIFNPVITKELKAEFNNEIRILNQNRHPNFILLMATVSQPPNLCIVSDFAHNGCLFDLLHKQK